MADMTKQMRNHSSFVPNEEIVEAVYGLGKAMLDAADSTRRRSPGYGREFEAAVADSDGRGLAAGFSGNGVLALTTERLLFFKKATVIGKPKEITAEVPIAAIEGAAYERPMVTVELSDGSVIGLHVPKAQRPQAFVQAVYQL